MKKEDTFETGSKLMSWLMAVVLAWLHAPVVGVVACVLAGIVGSEVDLYDDYE